MRSALGLWWISWFGIIGGFFMVGIGNYRHESQAASHFSLALMITAGILWFTFFVADAKFRKRVDGEKNGKVVTDVLTLAGTFLAVFSLLGIVFFVTVAPRLP
jgi:hypothetical protein